MQFDPRLPERDLRLLRAIYGADPRATILAAKRPERRFAVPATAWRRLLGCPRFAAGVVDALRVFRDRYAGVG